ncbi:lipid-binding SYLF domain-containing protein [Occallatibacter riparius]|uniref:Lipid-binding SYLF domain-containing protein n=1 Tax=Occallatibacter riparius TaxID=1002689 RepID=A0A9J7BP60_9BACT|nr:lipid-binding SYLF domain-containing protein [Occallatibacter riparius]UWZ82710.1 lipid-binding SYLF domain-containing protein [Occallatibacter riparius]
MKRAVVVLALLGFAFQCLAESDREKDINRLDKAARSLHELMSAPDQRIPDHVLKHARCLAVVPHLVKGGFVFGGEEGKGVATCRTATGWSAPTFFEMGGGSWGTQFGVESVDLVMVVRGREGMQKLLSSKFELGRDASAAVGPVGRHSSENVDLKMNALILTYSHAKGAFLGMTFDGAVVRPDNSAQRAMYGARGTTSRALLGEIPPPASARPFLIAVRGAEGRAVAHRSGRHARTHTRALHETASAH